MIRINIAASILVIALAANPFQVNSANAGGGDFCDDVQDIKLIITMAINVGAPIYNQGNHAACYMIYENASYKILYNYGKQCKTIKGILNGALINAAVETRVTNKAWTMRKAFDRILGDVTKTGF